MPIPATADHPGFYTRTILDSTNDGVIRVRRYLCQVCRRTVTLLPEFASPYWRSSITVIALFLITRLLHGKTLKHRPTSAGSHGSHRFRRQAEPLCAALSALTKPAPALNFVARALLMLNTAGSIPAHRFLFADVRQHLPRWPHSLIPDGRRLTIRPCAAPA